MPDDVPSENGADAGPATGSVQDTAAVPAETDDAYAGVFGAVPFAFRSTESVLAKSYVAAGGLLSLSVAVLFGLGVVALLGATATAAGGSFTFSRAFFIFVGLLVVAPLLAPVLFIARRHRRGTADPGYDRRLAALGYAFVGSMYVAGLISAPAEFQDPVTGPLAPVVGFLYSLPRLAGLVPPTLVALLIVVAGRRLT